jgi:hypothetical protein
MGPGELAERRLIVHPAFRRHQFALQHDLGVSRHHEVDGLALNELGGLAAMEVGAVKASTRYHERQFDTSLRDRKRVARPYNSEVERFSKRIGPLHQILTRATYKGMHRFNRKVWKTREAKPEAEQVAVAVDPISDEATFDSVQAMLKAKNPRAMPPRVVTGPILLTGIATCASCSGGMTLRTGKSGRYRYYTCATCA